jgi:CRISPR/Cas system-associated endoribonuclease Cas2
LILYIYYIYIYIIYIYTNLYLYRYQYSVFFLKLKTSSRVFLGKTGFRLHVDDCSRQTETYSNLYRYQYSVFYLELRTSSRVALQRGCFGSVASQVSMVLTTRSIRLTCQLTCVLCNFPLKETMFLNLERLFFWKRIE